MKLSPGQRRQASAVLVALQMFNLVLVLLQLWLFASVLEGILEGNAQMAVPAAFASLGLFAVNLWIFLGVRRYG